MMMRLCFGTFARVLRLCKLGNVGGQKLLGTITQTVDPNCQYIHRNNATAVSRLFKCEGNLSPGNITDSGSSVVKRPGESISDVIKASQKANKEGVAQKFRENVIGLLDEDKKELMVIALLHIIENDAVLDKDKKLTFEKYMGKTKNALLSQGNFALDEFLAGIFLYTASSVENTVGKGVAEKITEDYIKELRGTRNVKIVDYIEREIETITDVTAIEGTNVGLSDEVVDTIKTVLLDSRNEISATEEELNPKKYLSNVKNRYSGIKTLLYDKTPKEFYSFYVCNDLKQGDKTIKNINVKKLCLDSHFTIISGTGGLGKSMMMRHLLLNGRDNFETLGIFPVFISLKDYGETDEDILSYVFTVVKQFDGSITKGQFTTVIKKGSVLFLFDGLDEVKTTILTKFIQEVEALTNCYPQNYFVISSRPSKHFIALNKFYELELQPFNREQALKMISNFEFSIEEQRIKESFYTQLQGGLWFSHKEFAENPLLLTIMLMTFEEYAEVPSKIHKFYAMAFETLAKKHDDTKLLEREFKSGLSKDEIALYFSKICFLSYKDEKYELTEDEFKNYFDSCKNNSLKEISAADLLYDLTNNICLLLKEGKKYYFIHRSFQEYFCAKNFKNGFEKVSADKKESMSAGLISFFDRFPSDKLNSNVLEMLYDMSPEKVEEYIVIPKLEQIFEDDDLNSKDGYWSILKRTFKNLRCWYEYHECMEYDDETGEEFDESYYDFSIDTNGYVGSEVLQFIMFDLLDIDEDGIFDGTYYENKEIMAKVPLVVLEFERILQDEIDSCKVIDESGGGLRVIEYSTFIKNLDNYNDEPYVCTRDNQEHEYWLFTDDIHQNSQKHYNLFSVIESDNCHLRKICVLMQKYLNDLKSKQKATDEDWIKNFV